MTTQASDLMPAALVTRAKAEMVIAVVHLLGVRR